MTVHEMHAGDALALLNALSAAGVDVCIGGGWAVDALLGEQTRPHDDLDLWLPADQLPKAIVAFSNSGVDRLYPWGDERPWNFVLHDGDRRRVDLHLVERVAHDSFHYGGLGTGESFPAENLRGQGMIEGVPVPSETPQWSLQCHTGYEPRPVDRLDVARLCDRFSLALPPGFV